MRERRGLNVKTSAEVGRNLRFFSISLRSGVLSSCQSEAFNVKDGLVSGVLLLGIMEFIVGYGEIHGWEERKSCWEQ